METIIGQFSELARGHEAIDALLERKYEPSDISLLVIDEFGETTLTEARASSATSGVLGSLIGLGAEALDGTTVSAPHEDTNWPRALAKFGVPGPKASAYGEALRRGGALVLVRTNDAMSANIAAILATCGAVTIERFIGDSQA